MTWYSNWFDSKYYHLLYSNRTEDEAEYFLGNLCQVLDIKPNSEVLDLACGRGRHARFLNKFGLNVTGLDLSPSSISFAKNFENENLHFEIADMRYFKLAGSFDWIFNLFTSFGYFDTKEENLMVLERMAFHMKPGGKILIDFFDLDCVKLNLVQHEIIQRGDILFDINRSVTNEFVIKTISLTDNNECFQFEERVQALSKIDFLAMFEVAGLRLLRTFGDYNLNPHQAGVSPRMILLAEIQ
jgi:SAM-dependent methyltransferase